MEELFQIGSGRSPTRLHRPPDEAAPPDPSAFQAAFTGDPARPALPSPAGAAADDAADLPAGAPDRHTGVGGPDEAPPRATQFAAPAATGIVRRFPSDDDTPPGDTPPGASRTLPPEGRRGLGHAPPVHVVIGAAARGASPQPVPGLQGTTVQLGSSAGAWGLAINASGVSGAPPPDETEGAAADALIAYAAEPVHAVPKGPVAAQGGVVPHRGKALADPLPPEVGRVDAAVGGDRSGAGPKPAPALPGAAVEFASPAGAWRPVMKGAAGSDVPSPGAQAPAASGGRILDAAPPLPAPASALQTAPPAAVSKAGGGSGEVTEANGPAPRPSVPDVRHAAGDLTPTRPPFFQAGQPAWPVPGPTAADPRLPMVVPGPSPSSAAPVERVDVAAATVRPVSTDGLEVAATPSADIDRAEPRPGAASALHLVTASHAGGAAPLWRAVTDLPWRADPPPRQVGAAPMTAAPSTPGVAQTAPGAPPAVVDPQGDPSPVARSPSWPTPVAALSKSDAFGMSARKPPPPALSPPTALSAAGADRVVGVDRPVLAARMPGGLAPVASSAPDARIIRSDDPQKSAPPVLGRAPVAMPVPDRLSPAPVPARDPPLTPPLSEDPGAIAAPAAPAADPRAAAVAPLPATPPAPGLPLAVSRQLVEVLAERAAERTGSIDVALDPPELGRLRLSFGQAETGGALTLSIVAERPETADLMRRHLALLTQEFLRAGLDAPQVDISERRGGGQRDAPPASSASRTDADAGGPDLGDAPPPAMIPMTRPGSAEGLDLRL